MSTVAVAVADGMGMFGLTAPIKVFGVDRSDLAEPWYEFTLCGTPHARVGGWFRAEPAYGFEGLTRADTVIVPSAEAVGEPPAALLDALRTAEASGARVVSICTGAFVLAAAGLLDGRTATTHWKHAERLTREYPQVRVDAGVLYRQDGRIFTAAGEAAGLDLCLHLVRLDHGSAVANAIARNLVIPPHRDGGQAQFITTPMQDGAEDDTVARLLPWVLENLHHPISVPALARQVNTSSRTLARRFRAATGVSPVQWLHVQRLHRARELLETSEHSVEQIAARTGMGTATTLRRHFNRTLGVSPERYRRSFHAHDRTGTPSTPV